MNPPLLLAIRGRRYVCNIYFTHLPCPRPKTGAYHRVRTWGGFCCSSETTGHYRSSIGLIRTSLVSGLQEGRLCAIILSSHLFSLRNCHFPSIPPKAGLLLNILLVTGALRSVYVAIFRIASLNRVSRLEAIQAKASDTTYHDPICRAASTSLSPSPFGYVTYR